MTKVKFFWFFSVCVLVYCSKFYWDNLAMNIGSERKTTSKDSNQIELNTAINILVKIKEAVGSAEIKNQLQTSIQSLKFISIKLEKQIPKNVKDYLSSVSENNIPNRLVINMMRRREIHWVNSSYTEPYSGEVCPEVFGRGKYYYLHEDCSKDNAHRISQLVTIVLNFQTYQKDQQKFIDQTLNGIAQLWSNISIKAALPRNYSLKKKGNGLTALNVMESDKPGDIWNSLIDNVTTPYVFIGRDLFNFNKDIFLERLIREMYPLKLDIVGGAIKSASNGHWSHGCYQTVYKNYSLLYKHGYHNSAHDCIFCHFIQSPFLARTDFMKQHRFDYASKESTLFYNYFVELFKQKTRIAVCPDSMFIIRDKANRILTREEWLPVAMKRKLTRIFPPEGPTWEYTCKEVKIPSIVNKHFLNPPCYTQEMVDHLFFVLEKCEENAIYCEIRQGTLLNAVKYSRMSLWELDNDVGIRLSNLSRFAHMVDQFQDANYMLTPRHRYSKCWKSASQINRKVRMDMCRVELIDGRQRTEEQNRHPTKVLFHGHWVNAPHNVGLFLRNRLGPDIYRHKQHKLHLPGFLQQQAVIPEFISCPTPGDHRCLNNYKTDGSLQFQDVMAIR